jgi:hypothetical protein
MERLSLDHVVYLESVVGASPSAWLSPFLFFI